MWLEIMARFQPNLRMLSTLVGKYAGTSNAKAVNMLGWKPRSAEASIKATAQSMIDLGIVK